MNENFIDFKLNPEPLVPPTTLGFARIPYFLLVGALSMFMVEVGSGSSSLWFIDVWSLLVTFPLYLSHLLFFLNLAHRTGRTSVAQLYLFGCLFGLYESWITKVLWTGYSGPSGPILGYFAGLAWLEFLTLVFWSHPVCAFVIPVLTYEAFAVQSSGFNAASPQHAIVLTKSSARSRLLVILPILWSVAMGMNAQMSPFTAYFPAPVVAVISVAGSALLILFLKSRCQKHATSFNYNALILEKRGFRILTAYFIGFNVFWGIILNPQNFPSDPIGIYAVLVAYALFIGLLWLSPHQTSNIPPVVSPESSSIYGTSQFTKASITFAILAALLALSPAITQIVIIPTFIILPFGATVLFLWILLRKLYQKPK